MVITYTKTALLSAALLLSLVTSGCSSMAAEDNINVSTVVLSGYPEATLGDAFGANFKGGTWSTLTTRNGGREMLYQGHLDLKAVWVDKRARWIYLMSDYGSWKIAGPQTAKCVATSRASDPEKEQKNADLKAEVREVDGQIARLESAYSAEQAKNLLLQRQSVFEEITSSVKQEKALRDLKIKSIETESEHLKNEALGALNRCMSNASLNVRVVFPVNLMPDGRKLLSVGSVEIDEMPINAKAFLDLVFGG